MGDTLVVKLGAAFVDALMAASAWHRDQGRKGSRLPYLGHLLSVASIVIQGGGSEPVAIAALLHDAKTNPISQVVSKVSRTASGVK